MFKKFLFCLLAAGSLFLGACSSIQVQKISDMKNPKEIYEEGTKLIRAREYKLAIPYFQYVIDTYNKAEYEKYVSMSIYEIGFCHYRRGNYKEAIQYFNKVLQTAKSRPPRILANLVRKKILTGNGYKNANYKD